MRGWGIHPSIICRCLNYAGLWVLQPNLIIIVKQQWYAMNMLLVRHITQTMMMSQLQLSVSFNSIDTFNGVCHALILHCQNNSVSQGAPTQKVMERLTCLLMSSLLG